MEIMKEIEIRIPPGAAKILHVLEDHGYEAYVVGGCVRDSLLGRDPHDWDITTSALPMQVKALFRRTIDTGLKHGTVTVLEGGEPFEVTTYRVDGEYLDGRHPSGVTFTASLKEDLQRRTAAAREDHLKSSAPRDTTMKEKLDSALRKEQESG